MCGLVNMYDGHEHGHCVLGVASGLLGSCVCQCQNIMIHLKAVAALTRLFSIICYEPR